MKRGSLDAKLDEVMLRLDEEPELEAAVALARNAIRLYDTAADKFIAKAESGRARSVETYDDLKAVRSLTK